MAMVALSAPGSGAVAAAQPSSAVLTLLHASARIGPIAVFLDGSEVAESLSFRGTRSAAVPPSGTIRLVAAPVGDGSLVLLDTAVELSPRGSTLVVLVDATGSERQMRVVTIDTSASGIGPGRAKLLFLNADPGGGAASLANINGGFLAEGVEFGAERESSIEAGRLRVRAERAGAAATTAEETLDAEPGRTYVIALIPAREGDVMSSLLVVPGPRAGGMPAVGASATPSSVLIREDFADPTVGILPPTAPPGSILQYGYTGGEYLLRNSGVETRSVAVPGEYANVTIAIDARLVGDVDGRTVSVGCRFRSDANGNYGYRLRVEPGTALFRLVREDGTRDTLLVANRRSTAINRGLGVNRLELTCSGTTITGVINGVQVVRMQDSTYSSGPLTIGVGARSAGLTSEARFDNLTVTQR